MIHILLPISLPIHSQFSRFQTAIFVELVKRYFINLFSVISPNMATIPLVVSFFLGMIEKTV